MKKCAVLILETILLFLFLAAPYHRANAGQKPEAAASGRLAVSENGRYFVRDGKPFFWLGDSGWSLLSLYTPQEAREYLDHRRGQGFTVISYLLTFAAVQAAYRSAAEGRCVPLTEILDRPGLLGEESNGKAH